MLLKTILIARSLLLLPAFLLVSNSTFGKILNSNEDFDAKSVLVYRNDEIVSKFGGKKNSCPELNSIQRVGEKSQDSCYVLHQINLLGKPVVVKIIVLWSVDQWGEGFRLAYPNLKELSEAPYLTKLENQIIIQFEDSGNRAPSYYQFRISRQGGNLIVEEAILTSGDTHYFSYRFGDPDFTNINVTPVCRKKDLNYVVNEGATFDLENFLLDLNLDKNCVFCLVSYDDSEYPNFKSKMREYLSCQLREEKSKKILPLPKNQCLKFCETTEDNQWPPVE